MKKLLTSLALLTLSLLTSCSIVGPVQRGEVHAADSTPILWEAHGHGSPALVLIHC